MLGLVQNANAILIGIEKFRQRFDAVRPVQMPDARLNGTRHFIRRQRRLTVRPRLRLFTGDRCITGVSVVSRSRFRCLR